MESPIAAAGEHGQRPRESRRWEDRSRARAHRPKQAASAMAAVRRGGSHAPRGRRHRRHGLDATASGGGGGGRGGGKGGGGRGDSEGAGVRGGGAIAGSADVRWRCGRTGRTACGGRQRSPMDGWGRRCGSGPGTANDDAWRPHCCKRCPSAVACGRTRRNGLHCQRLRRCWCAVGRVCV